MLATELVLLTGGSPTKAFALCEELSIGPDTVRPLSYAMQKMNDTVALKEDETNTFLLAMENPQGALQEAMAAKFHTVKNFFANAQTGDESTAVAPVVEEAPDDEDAGDIDLFGDDEATPDPAVEQTEVPSDDDLPWDAPEDDLSFMDEPSLGAEPVSYDRTALEADDSEPELVVDTSPDVEDEDDLGDIFG